jgi:histone H3/H4
MSELSLSTKESFRNLCARHGFSSAKKETRQLMDKIVKDAVTGVTKQAMIQADYNGHTGINQKDVQIGIRNTPEIPKGIY